MTTRQRFIYSPLCRLMSWLMWLLSIFLINGLNICPIVHYTCMFVVTYGCHHFRSFLDKVDMVGFLWYYAVIYGGMWKSSWDKGCYLSAYGTSFLPLCYLIKLAGLYSKLHRSVSTFSEKVKSHWGSCLHLLFNLGLLVFPLFFIFWRQSLIMFGSALCVCVGVSVGGWVHLLSHIENWISTSLIGSQLQSISSDSLTWDLSWSGFRQIRLRFYLRLKFELDANVDTTNS